MRAIVAILIVTLYIFRNESDRTHLDQAMTSVRVTDPSSLGNAIRNARKALRITQEHLSLQTGISRTTIRLIEQGKDTAHIGLVLQLCRDLGIRLTVSSTDAVDGTADEP